MEKKREISVAFTGHREISEPPKDLFSAQRPATSPSQYKEAVRGKTAVLLEELYKAGYRRFYNGMAVGFDLLAAEAVVELRRKYADVELIAAVPYPGQSENFGYTDRITYNLLLGEADSVVEVSPSYSAKCFHLRNDYMVERSSLLVAFYNGTKGGTQYTVKKALSEGLEVLNLSDL